MTQAGLFYPQQAHDTKERLIEVHRTATLGTIDTHHMFLFCAEYSDEIHEMYRSLRKCVQLREEYMRLSLQRPGDNPKDLDAYRYHPVPPSVSTKPHAGSYPRLNTGNSYANLDFINEPLSLNPADIPGPDTVRSSLFTLN